MFTKGGSVEFRHRTRDENEGGGGETSITCDPRNVCARERDRGRERGHRGMNRVGEDTLNPI